VIDGGGGSNTLQFVSGASTGTFTGIGAGFVNFGSGTVNTHASWVFAGSNTIGSGVTLTNKGTLTIGGTLTNAGLITSAASRSWRRPTPS